MFFLGKISDRLIVLFAASTVSFVFILPTLVSADVSIIESTKPVESMDIDFGTPDKNEFGNKKEDDSVVERESVFNNKAEQKVPEKYKKKQEGEDLVSQLHKVEGKPLIDWFKGEQRKERQGNREKATEDKEQGKRVSQSPQKIAPLKKKISDVRRERSARQSATMKRGSRAKMSSSAGHSSSRTNRRNAEPAPKKESGVDRF